MLGIFARSKPDSLYQTLKLEKDLSEFKKIHYLMELEGEICTLSKEFNNNGNLRKAISRLRTHYNLEIYSEVCNCVNKEKAPLKKSGAVKIHKKYVKDWAI